MMAMAKMTLTSIPFSGLAALTRTQAPVSSLVMFKHLFTLIRAMAGLMMMKLLRKLENGHEEEEGVKIGGNFIYICSRHRWSRRRWFQVHGKLLAPSDIQQDMPLSPLSGQLSMPLFSSKEI